MSVSTAAQRVADHFRAQARSFDQVYGGDGVDGGVLARALRPVLFERTEAAARLVEAYARTPSTGPTRVLDVGCGPGRVAEVLLEAGAAELVGVDISEPMLSLAAERLHRYADRVQLVAADFLEADLEGRFSVVVGLGLFEYLEHPAPFVRRIRALCDGTFIGTFPRWTWTKGPIRKLRYQVINDCPIYDYTERELRLMFVAAGFETVMIEHRRHGFIVRAEV